MTQATKVSGIVAAAELSEELSEELTTGQQLEQKLQSLAPMFLHIENESHMHSGTATDSHFKVTLVSPNFNGVRTVPRHQKVYGLLAEELQGPVHALALHLYSPEEWQSMEQVPASPNCLGGSNNSAGSHEHGS